MSFIQEFKEFAMPPARHGGRTFLRSAAEPGQG